MISLEKIYDQFQIVAQEPNLWWAFVASCLVVVLAVMAISQMMKQGK